MKVHELIAELQKGDPDAEVTLHIGGPKDSAMTNEILEVKGGEIRGWVSSDNEDAYLPGD